MNKRRYRFVLISLALILIVVSTANLFLFSLSRTSSMLGAKIDFDENYSYWEIDPFSKDLSPKDRNRFFGPFDKETRKNLRNSVPADIKLMETDKDKYLALAKWVRGETKKVESEIVIANPYVNLKEMQAGKGAICGTMTHVFVASANSLGLPARYILLLRDLSYENYDTHAVAEVYIDGQWVVIDPTFNAYYTINGKMASAIEIQRNALAPLNDNANIKVNYVDDRMFSETIYDNYYINPSNLYNYVLLADRRELKPINKIPPGRYFYLSTNIAAGKNSLTLRIIRNYVIVVNLILPLLILIIIGAISIFVFLNFKANRGSDHKPT